MLIGLNEGRGIIALHNPETHGKDPTIDLELSEYALGGTVILRSRVIRHRQQRHRRVEEKTCEALRFRTSCARYQV
jgi:hypothetical protein